MDKRMHLQRSRGSFSLEQLLPQDSMPIISPKAHNILTPRAERRAFEKSKQIHRGKIILEIVDTEVSFLHQLSLVNSLYRKRIEASNVFPKAIMSQKIFPGLLGLITLHEDLLQSLQKEISSVNAPHEANISKIFLQFRDFMKVHSDYAPKHAKASEFITENYENNQEFKKVIDSIEQEPLYGITGLNSLRQATVTRLPRYILLFNELLKKTEEDCEEYQEILQVRETYTTLANRVNTFLKESADTAKVVALDRRFSSGSRAMLAPSQVLSKNTHRWKKHRNVSPTLCSWCNKLIGSGSSAKYCARCNVVVHTKNCRGLIHESCAEGTLMEQGRKFVGQFSGFHSCVFVSNLRASTSSTKQMATLVLFNDSVLIYYGEERAPHLVALIRWYSRSNNRKMQVNSSAPLSITLSSPRDDKNHIISFEDEIGKNTFQQALQKTYDKWFADSSDVLANAENLEEVETEFSEVPVEPASLQFKIEMTIPVKDFTAYVIEVREEWHTTTIFKRYSELYSLHKALCKVFSKKKLPKVPPKKRLKDNTCLHFVQKRCASMQAYLNQLLKIEGIQKVPEFQTFIRTTLAPSGEAEPAVPGPNARDDDFSEDESFSDETSPATAKDHEISEATATESEELETETDSGSSLYDSSVEFGSVTFDFTPGSSTRGLKVEKGDIVMVLSKESSSWWFCRTEDNRTGYLPRNFVDINHQLD